MNTQFSQEYTGTDPDTGLDFYYRIGNDLDITVIGQSVRDVTSKNLEGIVTVKRRLMKAAILDIIEKETGIKDNTKAALNELINLV